MVDVDEECDDGEATSRCDADCTLAECGDGTLNVLAGEDCDSGSFGEKTCADLGFLGGQLSCDQACAVDATQCGEFSVALSQTRRLDFFWPPVVNADYYEIHEEATPGGPPQQLGAKIFGETAAFEVPLHLRHNATYWLSACTEGKCSPVASLDLTGSLVDGIGVLQTDAPLASGIGATVSMSADGQTLATGNDFQRTYIFVRTGLGTWEFQTELTPSNLTFGDNFGASVSLSADGNVLAVGSPGEDSAASGINGDGDDNSLSSSGAAYVYTRDAAGVWTEQAYVKASNPGAGDIFGTAVVLNAAGDTLVVGARGEDSGATGIGGDQSDDSAPGVGAAYIFSSSGESWSQDAYVKPPAALDDPAGFGSGLSLDDSGDALVVTAGTDLPFAGGSVLEYRRSEAGTWSTWGIAVEDVESVGRIPVQLSGSGETLAIGYSADESAATGVDGDSADSSLNNAGAVRVFNRDDLEGEWELQAYVKATNTQSGDFFGRRLALSRDGNVLAVGALDASNATGINGNGANDSLDEAGGVHVYSRSEFGVWSVRSYVKSPMTAESDEFGTVALDAHGTTLAVGAEDADGGILGAVYLY